MYYENLFEQIYFFGNAQNVIVEFKKIKLNMHTKTKHKILVYSSSVALRKILQLRSQVTAIFVHSELWIMAEKFRFHWCLWR